MNRMTRGIYLLLCFALFINAGPVCVSAVDTDAPNTFFIAKYGSDQNDGSINSPFATLEAARDAVRKLKNEKGLPKGGVCVYLRGGVYNRLTGFKLEEQDSGTVESPITYRAYQDEKVEFIGGVNLAVSDFKRVGDKEILNRIYDRTARDFIYQYDLSKIDGFVAAEMFYPGSFTGNVGTKETPNELICDNEIMTIARWPNGDENFSSVVDVVSTAVENKGFAFTISDSNRANNWKTASDMRLYGLWILAWADQCMAVDNIKNGVITTATRASYNGPKEGGKFYAFNLLEELDAQGEFFIDSKAKILYFYPPENSTGNSKIYLSVLNEDLFSLNDVSNVTIRNFKVQAVRGKAFTVKGGENNIIAYHEIINTGGVPIVIDGKQNCGAVGNYICNANGGINIAGGDRQTLTPANNYAENNHIEKWSRITKTYAGGLSVGGVGNRLSYNKLHDARHLSMQYSGNENIIEFNEIYDVLQDVDDSGAIYAGRSWTWRGNQILNNYFHDLTGKSHGIGLGAIYCDDWLANATVSGNLFYNISGRAIWAEGGSDHKFTNNIMVDVKGDSVRIADRRADGTVYTEETHGTDKLWKTLMEVPYHTGIWAVKYPEITNILKDNPGLPKRNVVMNNVLVNSAPLKIDSLAEKNGTVKENISFTDPGFVDMKNQNFRLKPDAEVFSKIAGFEDIQFEKMGMYNGRLNQRISDSIVLAVNKAGAYVNAGKKQIDENDDTVVPVIENGRTLVPVRFICESLGADVGFDAEGNKNVI